MNKKIIALLLSMAMCLGIFAGCGGGDEAEKEQTENGEAANEIVVALSQQFTTLDPGLSTETSNSYAIAHMYTGLYKKLEDGSVVPALAEGEPEISEDGCTYTIHLKKDLKWSDGEPLTAHDFVYGINRNLTYGAENSFAIDKVSRYLKGADEYRSDTDVDLETFSFEGVTAIDDSTVQYQLKTPCAFFTGLLCGGAWLPLREDIAEAGYSEWSVEPEYAVPGAYILTYCNENEKIVLEKNENFYDAENVTMDKITFQVMPDLDAQAAAFKTGDVDVALSINTGIISTYENEAELWRRPQQTVYSINVNSGETGPEALKDVNVRRAISLAINREEICEALNAGDFYRPLYGYVPYGLKGAEKEFRVEADEMGKLASYDPEQAKQLLKEAGYDETNPLTLKYKYSNNSIHADVAQMLEQMWKAVGIQVQLDVVESGVFYDQVDQGDFELSRYALSCSNDPSEHLNQWTKIMQPVAAVDDAEYDQMMEEVAKIVDRQEYMKKLHEIEKYLVEENVYVIPLFDFNEPSLKKEYVQGAYAIPGGSVQFTYATIEKEAE